MTNIPRYFIVKSKKKVTKKERQMEDFVNWNWHYNINGCKTKSLKNWKQYICKITGTE